MKDSDNVQLGCILFFLLNLSIYIIGALLGEETDSLKVAAIVDICLVLCYLFIKYLPTILRWVKHIYYCYGGSFLKAVFVFYFIMTQIMAFVFFLKYCMKDSLLKIAFVDTWLSEIKGLLWIFFIW